MKILQIINSLATGGAEKLLLETIPLYREKGIEMDILVLNGTEYPFMKELKGLDCCAVYSLESKSVYNPMAIFKIIPYLRKYDQIHVHLFPAQYWVVLAKLLSFSKVKLVFTEHNTTNRRMGNKLFQLLDRFIYSRYHTVICITNEVKKILQEYTGAENSKFVVIENGVNLDNIRNSECYLKNEIHSGIDQEDTIIIQVAGFREQKDQATLIKALRYLPDTFKLLLVGDGILRKSCEDLAQELQLQNRVLFLGLRMDVPQLLKTADVVVLSSKYEGLSLSSIEGMASGRPFVASNVPGLSEVVGGAGILFEKGNARELAGEIEKLMNNPAYYQSVAKDCQERTNQYDINVMVDKHIKLYESIIKNKLIRTSTVAISLDYLLKGQLAFLQNNYAVLAVSGQDEYLEAVAQREGVKTLSLVIQRNISPLKDLKSLWQLYLLFKKEKPLIVHSITPKAGLLSMMAAYFARVPIRIHTFTGLIFPSKSGVVKQVLIVMDRVLCRCATAIYPEGQGVRNDLINYGITNKTLKVLANGNVNGIDLEYFNPDLFSKEQKQTTRNSLGIAAGDFVFIFVGRLVGDKGINELVAAFELFFEEGRKEARSKRQDREVKLLLVGPFESNLDALQPATLQLINTNKNSISVGFQMDVRSYLALSDCLVFPSYREGFPNVVLQAGAMGLPCIVTDISGCNEIIVDGENGCIIPVKDTAAVYEAMQKMIEDSDFRTHLHQNARPMIVSRYEQSVVWEAILEEYKRLEHDI